MTTRTLRWPTLLFLVAIVPAFALEAYARGGGGGGRGGGGRGAQGGGRGAGTGGGRTGTTPGRTGRLGRFTGNRPGASTTARELEALREAEERLSIIHDRRDRLMDLDRRAEQEGLLADQRLDAASNTRVIPWNAQSR